MGEQKLALDGGDPTVTAAMDERWETVTDLERQAVNGVLDNPGNAYSEIDRFQEAFAAFAGTRYAIQHAGCPRDCYSGAANVSSQALRTVRETYLRNQGRPEITSVSTLELSVHPQIRTH
jgi:hypothetical protein